MLACAKGLFPCPLNAWEVHCSFIPLKRKRYVSNHCSVSSHPHLSKTNVITGLKKLLLNIFLASLSNRPISKYKRALCISGK